MRKSTLQKIAILKIWLKVHFSMIFVVLLFFSATVVNAQLYWNTNGSGGTLTTANWGTSASGTFTTAWSNSSNIVFTANSAITNVTNIPVGNLTITNASTVTWTAAGTFSTNGAIRTFDIGTGSTLTWNGQGVSTTAGTGFIKNGGGVWNIGAQGNAYPGGFTLNAGTVVIGGVNALGTGVLTINGGVIVPNSGSSRTPANSSFVFGGNFQLGDATNFSSNTGALTFPATAAISLGASTRTITIGGTNTGTLSGVISGDAGSGLIFNSTSTGFINLSGVNTYSGPTTINSGAIVRLPATTASASPLGTTESGTTVNSGGNLELNSNRSTNQEPITINGDGISGGGAISNNVANSYADINGLVTLGSSSSIIAGSGTSQSIFLRNTGTITGSGYNLTIGGGNAASTNTSQIYSIIGTGTGTLTKTGPGTWYLYGANTYTGLTTVTNGVLILSKTGGGTLPSTNNVAVSGGTLRVSSNQTIANLDMSGGGSLVVDAGVTLTITGTYTSGSGTISNLGTIILNGSSSQTFPGSGMTINNGTANTMTNLTVNNSTGVIIDKSIIVSGLLTVTPLSKLTLLDSGINLTATNGITLQSSTSGTATFVDNNNSSPQAVSGTVEQHLASARNWYLSSPIAGATIPAGQTYYSYDETGSNVGFVAPATLYWVAVPEGTAINPMKGYITQPGAATTKSYTGTFNTGTKTIALTRTNSASKPGFNLVANPYPSYLDWSMVDTTAANIQTSVWYRTKTSGGAYTFDTYNGKLDVATANGENTVSKLIPPMQAFWVRVKTGFAGGTLTFDNTMRKHADVSGNKMKAPKVSETKVVRLQLSNGTDADEALVCFNSNAQNSFDSYDSPKMFESSATRPELYTLAGNEKVVINGLSDLNELSSDMELPLGFTTGAGGNFTLKATEIASFDNSRKLYLRDKQENRETELTPETEYAFSTTAATSNNESRFSLLFKAPGVTTGTTNANSERISVFVNTQNQITIIANPNSNYSIYNAMGQLIENGTLNSEFRTQNPKLAAGVYVVKVNNQSTRVVVK